MPKGSGRKTQSCAFTFLNIFIALEIVLGITAIALNEYFKHTISKHVGHSEGSEIRTLLFFMEVYGLHLIVFYGCGFLIVTKFRREPYTAHLLTLLKIWHIFIFVLSVDGFLTTWVLFNSVQPLMCAVELSLRRGIEVYYSNPEWRIIWDDMQYHQQCCGVESYKDWQTTSWIEYEYEDNMAMYQEE
ncbi:unnamed protein product [Hermetia illucens]|uniref:Uncharacterized protein n=2 Tax=Hermetia illucens TaxID=343691 RepID=A0A7R8UEP6_HERIL|nr:unnamed protein product [Hermetia illucens]